MKDDILKKLVRKTTLDQFYCEQYGIDLGTHPRGEEVREKARKNLNTDAHPNAEIWEYDDMGFLCGTRGLVAIEVAGIHIIGRA